MESVHNRRLFLTSGLAAISACASKKAAGFPGYAFVANQEGQAVAAVDLTAFAVVTHIRIDGHPSEVIAHPLHPSIYVLTPENGTLHEIDSGKLAFKRKLAVGAAAHSMRLAPDSQSIWVLTRNPNQLMRISLQNFKVDAILMLPAEPVDMDVVREGNRAAVSFGGAAAPVIVSLTNQQLESTVKAVSPVSIVRLQSDGKQLIAAHQDEKMLSFYAVPSGEVVTRLPLAIKPKNLCFKQDGGQLFVTGEGMDAVVVIYPYRTEVRETVLAGHMPGAMAAATADEVDFLFVANPQSGDVTVLNVATTPLRVVGVAPVGKDPGFIVITPDNQYALVLNRESGDMAVIRIKNVAQNRARKAPLFTMIPVGSRPVSAVVRAV